MKTYIWNSEYEVYVVNAESENMARMYLIRKWKKLKRDHYKNHMETTYGKPEQAGTLLIGQADSYIHSTLDDGEELLSVLTREPDLVLEGNQAEIYSHSNA